MKSSKNKAATVGLFNKWIALFTEVYKSRDTCLDLLICGPEVTRWEHFGLKRSYLYELYATCVD